MIKIYAYVNGKLKGRLITLNDIDDIKSSIETYKKRIDYLSFYTAHTCVCYTFI